MEDEYPNVHGAAYKELVRRFGGLFRTRFTLVNGGGLGVPIQLAQADAERVFILFLNISAGNVSIGPTPAVALTGGIVLPTTTDRSFNLNDHASLPTEEWWQNTAIGNGLGVLEVRREGTVKKART